MAAPRIIRFKRGFLNSLKTYFTRKQLLELRAKLETVSPRTDRLLLRYVAHPFTNEKAKEYARNGFSRRLQTLRRCIENTFRVLPPGAVRVPAKTKLYDTQINLQAFVANAYGSVDNLAWIWVHERGLVYDVKPRQVGLRSHNTQVRSSFSSEFQAYLDGIEGWFAFRACRRASEMPPRTRSMWAPQVSRAVRRSARNSWR